MLRPFRRYRFNIAPAWTTGKKNPSGWQPAERSEHRKRRTQPEGRGGFSYFVLEKIPGVFMSPEILNILRSDHSDLFPRFHADTGRKYPVQRLYTSQVSPHLSATFVTSDFSCFGQVIAYLSITLVVLFRQFFPCGARFQFI